MKTNKMKQIGKHVSNSVALFFLVFYSVLPPAFSGEPLQINQASSSTKVKALTSAPAPPPTTESQLPTISIKSFLEAPPPPVHRYATFEGAVQASQPNARLQNIALHSIKEDTNPNPLLQGKKYQVSYSFDIGTAHYGGRSTATQYSDGTWKIIDSFGLNFSVPTRTVQPPVVRGSIQDFDRTAPQNSSFLQAAIDYFKNNPSAARAAGIYYIARLTADLAAGTIRISVGGRLNPDSTCNLSIEVVNDPCAPHNFGSCMLASISRDFVAKAVKIV